MKRSCCHVGHVLYRSQTLEPEFWCIPHPCPVFVDPGSWSWSLSLAYEFYLYVQINYTHLSRHYPSTVSPQCLQRLWCSPSLLWTLLFGSVDLKQKTHNWRAVNLNYIWGFWGGDHSLDYSLLKKLIYYNWRLITLQYCDSFCHTLTWICHGTHVSPKPKPPPTSLSTPALWVVPVHWLWVCCFITELGLVIYFTYGNIHFQCYSLKSSHPHLLQSPKVCSLHLCLFYCLAYRIIIVIFLNSIYLH